MISFLEFVCEKLMGPPAYGRSWRCPFHDDHTPSFSVRPPKEKPGGGWYPIKFKCHACEVFGDEFDLIQHFYPDETRKQQTERWKRLGDEYEELTGKPATRNSPGYSAPGTRGPDLETLSFCLSELRSVLRERGAAWPTMDVGLYSLVWASQIAEENRVPLENLVRHCASELIALRNVKGQKYVVDL